MIKYVGLSLSLSMLGQV